MRKIVLYINKGNQKYEVRNCKSLKEGHEAFNKERKDGDYVYLELGLDGVDVDGKYSIIRKSFK